MWDGVGHFVMMERPKEFNEAVLAFLDKNKLLEEMKQLPIANCQIARLQSRREQRKSVWISDSCSTGIRLCVPASSIGGLEGDRFPHIAEVTSMTLRILGFSLFSFVLGVALVAATGHHDVCN